MGTTTAIDARRDRLEKALLLAPELTAIGKLARRGDEGLEWLAELNRLHDERPAMAPYRGEVFRAMASLHNAARRAVAR